jgi:hypothetical protein
VAIKATGAGVRAGAATKRIVVCRVCGAKNAVPLNAAGNIRCDGCGEISRVRR